MKELAKTYDPKGIEERLYKKWEDNGYFHAEVDRSKKPFTIVMPPPNITGQLHMGHALDNTMQDILIRYKRMQGYNALWQPGTDHASIATEVKVIQSLKEKGIDKADLGREGFLEKCWEWREEYGNRIINQLKKLGSSADWQRERFTMDKGCSDAVQEVFIKLYEKGYIYKGSRIVNWCPVCKTSISDAEVEHEEQDGFFWHINYPVVGEEGRFVEIATTRPETLFGDTAVAVNPDDERYKDIVGKMLKLPMTDREIPVIADPYVDKEFGTGCVKITPAHDPNDFEVGKRHNLEEICIMNDDATISVPGKYQGMDRYEARKAMVEDLKEMGLLVKVVPHSHNVGTHDRCGTTVEPMVKPQWFVKMEELAKPAINALKTGELRFVPERFDKIYLHWLENIRDWCISRQLWWGHRIPAWYDEAGNVYVARNEEEAQQQAGEGVKLTQDDDVLDTWFSSAMVPFSTIGWPNPQGDEKTAFDLYLPSSVLVTGYDIIFFWVARMIFSGCEQMKKIPFHTVLIHGLVRDDKGRKMSKSLGNGIDPLEMAEKYGADALRFNLITGNSPGNDMRFYVEKCEAMRNFCNKIWNASRFVMMNLTIDHVELPEKLELEDKWILSKLNTLIREVTDNMDAFELGVASAKIYDFIWDNYCDWFIELTKNRLNSDDQTTRENAQNVLCYVLIETLKLLHPFMPFITEEIWQALPHEGEFLMLSKWPEYNEEFSFPAEEEAMQTVIEAITAIRARRNEMNVAPSKKVHYTVATAHADTFSAGIPFFTRLASASDVTIVPADAAIDADGKVEVDTHAARIFMPLAELVDFEKELARIAKEKANAEKQLAGIENKLKNEGFLAKAPEAVVNGARADAEKLRALIEKLDASAAAMKK
mgnify:CR=1 FL=1